MMMSTYFIEIGLFKPLGNYFKFLLGMNLRERHSLLYEVQSRNHK